MDGAGVEASSAGDAGGAVGFVVVAAAEDGQDEQFCADDESEKTAGEPAAQVKLFLDIGGLLVNRASVTGTK